MNRSYTLHEAIAEIELLKRDNQTLRELITSLERKLSFFDQHQTTGEGKRGERLLADALRAALTSHKSSFDLLTGAGTRIEVKTSRLTVVGMTSTKRWVWNQIFGLNGNKNFDYIILMGESDERFVEHYPGNDPYLFVLLDHATAKELSKGGSKGKYIQLVSNPTGKLARNNPLWRQVKSLSDLERQFGSISGLVEA